MIESPYRSWAPGPVVDGARVPSRFRLPQRCSEDRRRGREALLRQKRRVWRFAHDTDLPGSPAPGFALPNYAATLPPEARFTIPKLSRLLSHKMAGRLNFALTSLLGPWRYRDAASYQKVFRLFPGPDKTIAFWRDDEEFARQRISGVNPMALRRCDQAPSAALARAAEAYLASLTGRPTLDDLRAHKQLYIVDHSAAADPRIQQAVARQKRVLAAPTALFFVDGGRLMPLAIRLQPDAVGDARSNPVFTPSSKTEWLVARTHFQAADANHHQGVSHLLETHLVVEAIAVAAARTLHPDHPLSQLFAPHFSFNLAIDHLARTDLLGPAGPIQVAMAGGVSAVLDRARMAYSSGWDFMARSPVRDLAARGFGADDRDSLPNFHYRDDILELHEHTRRFVADVLGQWYASADDVCGDDELQAFVREASGEGGANIPGFPARVETLDELCAMVTEVVFRASAQHAAVNNGQFEAYGFIPNAPGSFDCPLPRADDELTEADWLLGLPTGDRVTAQVVMTWVLTEPTHRNFLNTGDAEAFAPELSPIAARAVEALQFRLSETALRIESRNRVLDKNGVPYWFLNPTNISRSIDT